MLFEGFLYKNYFFDVIFYSQTSEKLWFCKFSLSFSYFQWNDGVKKLFFSIKKAPFLENVYEFYQPKATYICKKLEKHEDILL